MFVCRRLLGVYAVGCLSVYIGCMGVCWAICLSVCRFVLFVLIFVKLDVRWSVYACLGVVCVRICSWWLCDNNLKVKEKCFV